MEKKKEMNLPESHNHKFERINDFTVKCDCGEHRFSPNANGKMSIDDDSDCGMSGC